MGFSTSRGRTVYADLKPDQKVEKVRELSAQYGHVAMVGDGVKRRRWLPPLLASPWARQEPMWHSRRPMWR